MRISSVYQKDIVQFFVFKMSKVGCQPELLNSVKILNSFKNESLYFPGTQELK